MRKLKLPYLISKYTGKAWFYIFRGSFTIQLATLEPGNLASVSQEIVVQQYYINPSWTQDALDGNDFALLRLVHAPRIDNFTRPICLGNLESFQKILDKGTDAECYITGNGYQETYVMTGSLCCFLLNISLNLYFKVLQYVNYANFYRHEW